MNRKILASSVSLALVSLLAFSGFGKTYTYTNMWGDPGYNLISSDASGVEVVYSLEEFAIEDVDINGQTMQAVVAPGCFLPNTAGAPNLPGFGRWVAIPQGASAKLIVLDYSTEIIEGIDVVPAPPIPLDTDKSPLVYIKDPSIYNRNANFPENPFQISERTEIRGVDVVILGIAPFQYNPMTKKLTVYRDVRVRIDFLGGNGHFGNDALRGRFWDPILQEHLLNFSSLPTIDFDRRLRENTDETNVEYLIIIPDDPEFSAWADSIKNWRKLQGITTGITRISEIPGGNTPNAIENYINTAYNTWTIRPEAVLLLSDYQNTGDNYGITSPVWNNYCVSDNIYADVGGNDLPDIAFSRILAQNGTQLQRIINKILTYERTPVTTASYYDNPLIAAGWQTDRWFVLCAEICYGFFSEVLDKRPTRQYAGTTTPPTSWSSTNPAAVVAYFGPAGLGYIPASPSYLTNWTGNATGINAAINAGAFLVLHRDHGSETGWGTPSYTNPNLSGLTNTQYPFVFSLNCLTGKYNWTSECFCEAFSRMQYGAVGLVAASEVSYSFVNDTFCWGMWDSMWPNFDPGYGGNQMSEGRSLMTGFAQASGKYYLAVNNWPPNPANKAHTNNLFHHYGDGFFTLYSEVPQNLMVLHAPVLLSGTTTFSVTANTGALIGLTVNGNIIGTGTGTGAPVSIPITPQIPGQNMVVTVTLANYFRYSQEVPIVPPTGSYVIFGSLAIDDALGNNNGQWDYGETVYLDFTVQNVGTVSAPNVSGTISTTDTLASILTNTASFGTVNANSTAFTNNAYRVSADGWTEDQHIIAFNLVTSSDTSSWTSYFSIPVNAPEMEFASLEINDSIGGNNNGNLDPGESATLLVTLTNAGGCYSTGLSAQLSETDPYVNITTNIYIYGTIQPGANAVGSFTVSVAANCPQEHEVTFNLNFADNIGYNGSGSFVTTVGDITYMPTGPDAYGYSAYDPNDLPEVPVYSWTEISADSGGLGTRIGFTADDQLIQFPLPFDFQYYGVDFDTISVSTNGYVCMGVVTVDDYSNSAIPNTDGPPNMVAAYWEDLSPQRTNSGGVWYYYDAVNHRYIVEYNHIEQYTPTNNFETFQVIFYDPAFYQTSTGDGRIKVQYKQMSVASQTEGTIGIENQAETIGLQYFFDGIWDVHAMPIENGMCILYTTITGLPTLDVTITPVNPPIVIPAAGGSFSYTAQVSNPGTNTTNFDVWVMVTLPTGTNFGPVFIRPGMSLAPGAQLQRNMSQNVPGTAPAGNYTYIMYGGNYNSGLVYDQSSFSFAKLGVVDNGGTWETFGWDENFGTMVSVPSEFFLAQNYPNPFNPETTFNYGLPEAATVTLALYDVLGRQIALIFEGKQDAGYHSVKWNASGLSSGVYFYRLEAGSNVAMKKCILMK